ncbi:MAG TPA: hypothetical protein VIM64_01950 [Puia sp.]
MKGVNGITSLSYGAIASNVVLFGVLCYNINFTRNDDLIAFFIVGFGLVIPILYALQLILIKRSYYRHRTIGVGAKVFLHICRIIQLVYSLIGTFLVAATVYNSFRRRYPVYTDSYEYKRWAVMAAILVTVVMNFTIFFKGWRLLKLVKRPYLEELMASFD